MGRIKNLRKQRKSITNGFFKGPDQNHQDEMDDILIFFLTQETSL